MASPSTLFRYIVSKFEYSVSLVRKANGRGQTMDVGSIDTIMKNLFVGKLTFLHWIKGEEMAPTIGTHGGTLLVRKIPAADPTRVYIGDVVVLKDPMNPDKYIVRRLAAIEGDEMVSTVEEDEPFFLQKDECWVVADNENLKPRDLYDSRTFGPVTMNNIVGRVLYCLRNAVDHGPVNNSDLSEKQDSPVLEMELDVEEMKRNQKL